MNDEPKRGKPWLWAIIGGVVGLFLGGLLGPIGAVITSIIIAMLAFKDSKKNNGAPPAWLWRSKKK